MQALENMRMATQWLPNGYPDFPSIFNEKPIFIKEKCMVEKSQKYTNGYLFSEKV